MASRLHRTLVAAAYQLSLLAGIILLPVAMLARKVGLPLPLDRVVSRLRNAYENAETDSS